MAATKKTVPATAKKPQDHLSPKAEASNEPTIFTHNDVEYTIAPGALDNIELVEALEDERYITAVKLVVGDDQWQTYKEANRDEMGRVPTAAFEDFVSELFR